MLKLKIVAAIAAAAVSVVSATAAEQPKPDGVPAAQKPQTSTDWKTRQARNREDYLRYGGSQTLPLPQHPTLGPQNLDPALRRP